MGEVRRVSSQKTLYQDISVSEYDASKTTPVFYGRFPRKIEDIVETDREHITQTTANCGVDSVQDSTIVHPATFGYLLLDKIPVVEQEKASVKPLPDLKTCSPREFLENYIFPFLLPGLEEMLIEAKSNKVFEKRRTKFNACDYLTAYLYRHNPKYMDRAENDCLEDIPFVKEILAVNPRPPIPLSLLLSDNEAATIIQSHYRGYQIRKQPEVHELRQYQKEMREEEVDITFRVEDFWRKHSLEHVE